MTTISDKLQRIADAKMAIKDAIEAKGVEVADAPLEGYADKIAEIPTGGGAEIEPLDVEFCDCDGTTLYTYTAEEFLAMSEMPPLPTREGLICQSWNWDIADAKEYVAEMGGLIIGATYITDDGATRLYMELPRAVEVPLTLSVSQVGSGVVIDWGDGATTTLTSKLTNTTQKHSYSSGGNYVIRIIPTEGAVVQLRVSVFNAGGYAIKNSLVKFEGGANCEYMGAFIASMYSLNMLTIPNEMPYNKRTENDMFQNCFSLDYITIPKTVTRLGARQLQYCNIRKISIPKITETTVAPTVFYRAQLLEKLWLPNTEYASTQYCSECKKLKKITIPSKWKSFETQVFNSCLSLSLVVMPSNLEYITANAFNSCQSVFVYDFRKAAFIPELDSSSAIAYSTGVTKIVVPDALYDDWIVATNWADLASMIVKASNYTE